MLRITKAEAPKDLAVEVSYVSGTVGENVLATQQLIASHDMLDFFFLQKS